jgi:transposase
MVAPPSPEQEDQRRISRERAILLRERVRHVNRIKGLLASQGITDFEPLHKDRRVRLDALRTGDGRLLPPRLKAELLREIELIELLLLQIAEVETERDSAAEFDTAQNPSPIALLIRLRGIGSQIASVAILKAFTGTLAIGARRRRGAAARSIESKAFRKQEIRVCATSWWNSPGCG